MGISLNKKSFWQLIKKVVLTGLLVLFLFSVAESILCKNPYYYLLKFDDWYAKELNCSFSVDKLINDKENFWTMDSDRFDTSVKGMLTIDSENYQFNIHSTPNVRGISFGNIDYFNGSTWNSEEPRWRVDGKIRITLFNALFKHSVKIIIASTEGTVFPESIKELTLLHD